MLGDMGLTCLLVDDSARFRDSARALLEREGLDVVLASNGEEAVRRLHEVQPDVVLVDINLGDESGIELAHALDVGSTEKGARIILISTHAGRDFEDLVDASPALGFLPKSSLSAEAIRHLLARGD
jgi:CheY-like chemotaxis protein